MAYQIPNFLMGQTVAADFSPIQNALAQWQKQRQFEAKLNQDQSQFEATNALARGRFGMEKARFDEEQARRAQWDAQFANGTPEWTKSLPAGTADILRLSGAGAAPQALNMLAQQPDLQLRRASLAEQIEQRRAEQQHRQVMYPLQEKELQLKVQASQQKDPEREFLSNIFSNIQRGAQPQPQGPQPGAPMLQPQSFEGGGDAQLIQTQAGNGPAAPQAEMVDVPGVGRMTKQQAEALRFALAKDRGAVMKDALDADKIGKEGGNKIDEEIIAKLGDVAELDNIKKQFRPQFLEIGGRLKAMGTSWQAYLNSKSVKPEDRKYLSEFSRFAAASQERMNTRIKAMSGSAVSGHEEVRLNKANPSVGDDPITYESKLAEQIHLQKAALSRYMWLKNVRGLNHGQIASLAKAGKIESLAGLDDMRGIADQRGAQIEQELQGKVPPERMREVVRQRLKQEFGI